jgi:hypothetical protein
VKILPRPAADFWFAALLMTPISLSLNVAVSVATALRAAATKTVLETLFISQFLLVFSRVSLVFQAVRALVDLL